MKEKILIMKTEDKLLTVSVTIDGKTATFKIRESDIPTFKKVISAYAAD